MVTDAIEELIALLAMSSPTAAQAAGLHERVQALLSQLPRIEGECVPVGYVTQLTRPREGQDCVHEVVAVLHRAVAELQATLARETVDGVLLGVGIPPCVPEARGRAPAAVRRARTVTSR